MDLIRSGNVLALGEACVFCSSIVVFAKRRRAILLLLSLLGMVAGTIAGTFVGDTQYHNSEFKFASEDEKWQRTVICEWGQLLGGAAAPLLAGIASARRKRSD
jgi:hypothetical protein